LQRKQYVPLIFGASQGSKSALGHPLGRTCARMMPWSFGN
jgi:hypothetical protein